MEGLVKHCEVSKLLSCISNKFQVILILLVGNTLRTTAIMDLNSNKKKSRIKSEGVGG